VPEELLAAWEQRVSGSAAMAAHRERGNRFLDRRFAVPIGDPALALFPEPV
jgi:hypothetical protein